MPFVAILGAGPLGGAIAHALACRNRFDDVRLIDPEKTLAAGKALDILQSGPVDGSSARVTGHPSLDAANGAWVILLADPVSPDPVTHIGELHRRSPGAVIVAADASHALPIGRAVATGAVQPDRITGSAPTAVASAARALIALDEDISPSRVHAAVTTGVGPGTCRIDWTRTTIDGESAGTVLHRERQDRLDGRLAALGSPGPLTLASAAARLAEAAWFGSRVPHPAWWVTDGGAGPPTVHDLRFAPGGRARVTR